MLPLAAKQVGYGVKIHQLEFMPCHIDGLTLVTPRPIYVQKNNRIKYIMKICMYTKYNKYFSRFPVHRMWHLLNIEHVFITTTAHFMTIESLLYNSLGLHVSCNFMCLGNRSFARIINMNRYSEGGFDLTLKKVKDWFALSCCHAPFVTF